MGAYIAAADADEGVAFLRELGARELRPTRVVGYVCKCCGADWDMRRTQRYGQGAVDASEAPKNQPVMLVFKWDRPPDVNENGFGHYETTCCGARVERLPFDGLHVDWAAFRPPVAAVLA